MKGGLSFLIEGFCATSELDLPGKVTLTCTSDEETGGRWGALWLLENVSDLIGDAVLNGEPSGGTVRIGEKGMVPFTVKTRGKPAHWSFAGYAGENAIMKMGRLLPEIEALRNIPAKLTEEEEALTEELGYTVQFGHEAEGLAGVLRHVHSERRSHPRWHQGEHSSSRVRGRGGHESPYWDLPHSAKNRFS